MLKKLLNGCLVALLVLSLAGCSSNEDEQENVSSVNDTSYQEDEGIGDFDQNSIPSVEIRFGDNGEAFEIDFEKNETALTLARNITDDGRRLPIYNYDDFEGYEYFQYYDIPSSYDIPDDPQQVNSQKAGEIYYSSPNRVMLFYQDANISGMYTKVGEIKNTEGLYDAVVNNPVLEGWGNKIVNIQYAE